MRKAKTENFCIDVSQRNFGILRQRSSDGEIFEKETKSTAVKCEKQTKMM